MKKKILDWFYVLLTILAIFLTLPYGPKISGWLFRQITPKTFMIILLIIAIELFLYLIYYLIVKRKQTSFWSYNIILITTGIYAYYFSTMVNPAEKLHFFEYGLLGIFLFRALSNYFEDSVIYFLVIIYCYCVGIIDEQIQFMLRPVRVGEVSDTLINGLAGLLVTVAIWFGISPRNIIKRYTLKSVVVLCVTLMTAIIGFGLFAVETTEFGYKITDDEIGAVYSRMDSVELQKIDTEKSIENSKILDENKDTGYSVFLNNYPAKSNAIGFFAKRRPEYKDVIKNYRPNVNPFIYEMRIHIFRRDKYFDKQDYLVVYKENLILEKYFGNTIKQSVYYKYSDDTNAIVKKAVGDSFKNIYESPVSKDLSIKMSVKKIWTIVIICEIVIMIGSISIIFYLRRKKIEGSNGVSPQRFKD